MRQFVKIGNKAKLSDLKVLHTIRKNNGLAFELTLLSSNRPNSLTTLSRHLEKKPVDVSVFVAMVNQLRDLDAENFYCLEAHNP